MTPVAGSRAGAVEARSFFFFLPFAGVTTLRLLLLYHSSGVMLDSCIML